MMVLAQLYGNAETLRSELFSLLVGAAAWPLGARAAGRSDAAGRRADARRHRRDADIRCVPKSALALGSCRGRDHPTRVPLRQGRPNCASGLAAELVRLPVDVIVTDSMGAAIAAFGATRSIPIVMGTSVDPVEAGLVASIENLRNTVWFATL